MVQECTKFTFLIVNIKPYLNLAIPIELLNLHSS